MKKTMFIIAAMFAVVIGFTACSSSKAVSETGKALNREEVEVKMTKSEELAFEKPATRASGEGTNFDLSFAKTYAEGQARAEFQRKLEALVKTASEQGNTGNNVASTTGAESGLVGDQGYKNSAFAKQVAEGIVRNTAIIHADKFKKVDGQYHVYVCIEYLGEISDIVDHMVSAAKRQVPQQVSDEERLKIQFELEQFKKSLEEDFKKLSEAQNR